MGFPLINLDTPTHLAIQVGWYLLTWANFVVYLLLLAVFIVGITVRLPGTKRELARMNVPMPPPRRQASHEHDRARTGSCRPRSWRRAALAKLLPDALADDVCLLAAQLTG